VTEALHGSGPVPADPAEHAQLLVAAGYAWPPARLGELAPLVSAAAAAGDPAARRIVATAAARLLAALDAVAGAAPAAGAGPVVLAGSVLLSAGPVRDAVLSGMRDRFGAEPVPARDGAAGAAALALARWRGGPVPAEVHARLISG
jgi:N-acetylglucosamine kinase-like BadF-type ATPase